MYKRNKYDYKFRLRCVEAVLKKGQPISVVAKEKGFDKSNLRLWVLFYQQYGKSGLQPRNKAHYNTSFKLKVLKALEKDSLSLREACIRFNIPSDSIIISWRKAFEQKGEQGLISKPKGRPKKMKSPIKRKPRKSTKPLTREEELQREIEYLRAENELLKKLQALVQANKKRKP